MIPRLNIQDGITPLYHTFLEAVVAAGFAGDVDKLLDRSTLSLQDARTGDIGRDGEGDLLARLGGIPGTADIRVKIGLSG